MRVSCERCSTEYDFDATLIARGGTRVRCTNCGHVFRLMPEEEVGGNWTVRTLDGDLIEIATIAELKSRIISRELTEDDEIRRGNEAWKPLGEIAELAPHFDASRSRESRPRASTSLHDEPSSRMSETAKKTLLGIGLAPVDEAGAGAEDDATTEDDSPTIEAPPQYHRTIQMQPGAIPPPAAAEDPALRATLPSVERPGSRPEPSLDKTLPAMDSPTKAPSRGSSSDGSGWFETPSMVPPEPSDGARPSEASSAHASTHASAHDGRAQLHFDEDDEIFPGRKSSAKKKRKGLGLGVWLALLLGLGFGLGVGFRDSLPEPLRENVNAAFESLRGLFIADTPEGDGSADGDDEGEDAARPAIAPHDGEEAAAKNTAEDADAAKDEEADQNQDQADGRQESQENEESKKTDAPAEVKKPQASAAARTTPASQPASDTSGSLSYDALVRRADAALERGRSAAARRDYEQALELRPGASEALTGLGFIALDAGSANQAATHFRRAAANGYADAYIGLGGAYRRLGRLEDALAAYERYLERWPNGNQASVARAQASALRASLAGSD